MKLSILQVVVDQHFYKILSLNIDFIIGNSADPDEMPPYDLNENS